jgi:sugar O-acyltransferase (sialic acid O-acetyltransferase NeuD family)
VTLPDQLPGLLLLAASGLAREVAATVTDTHRLVGVLDDDPSRWGLPFAGSSISGPIEAAAIAGADAGVVICAGKGSARRAIAGRLAADVTRPAVRYLTVVHSSAVVPGGSALGVGCVLLPGVVLTADVVLGDHVVAMPGAVLTHDDVLEDFVTVCAGVKLGGSVVVGQAACLGAGSLIREGCRIGAGATVGMGAVVLQDVPAGEVWVGNPARPIRSRVTA